MEDSLRLYRFWIRFHHAGRLCRWNIWAFSEEGAIAKLPSCVSWDFRYSNEGDN